MPITTRSGKGAPLTHEELDANFNKLDGIEDNATADQTGAEIKALYEAEADTNAFTNADHTKLDGIETSADVTDATNVDAAGAVMESDTTTANMSFVVDEDDMLSDSDTKLPTQQSVKAYVDSQVQSKDALSELSGTLDDIADGTTYVKSTNDYTDAEVTKLSGIEASADVTDTTNVTAAGALMDSEVTNLADVKSFDPADYATSAQGTTADNALPKAGGTLTGDLSLGDNVKAQFGAGNDLQIYHDGSNSVIKETGTGNLYITTDGAEIRLAPYGANENGLRVLQDGAVLAYYDNSTKLATTSTGIDVTGRITTDGITEDTSGNVGIGTSSPQRLVSQHVTAGTNYHQFTNPTTGTASSDGTVVGLDSTINSIVWNYESSGGIILGAGGSEKARILPTGGITFNGDTAAANALDDYEEGTYNPVFTPSTSGSIGCASSANALGYTKVGNVVHICGYLYAQYITSPVGNIAMTLPFTPANLTDYAGASAGQFIIHNTVSANMDSFYAKINDGTADATIYRYDAQTSQSTSAEQVKAGSHFYVSITYKAA